MWPYNTFIFCILIVCQWLKCVRRVLRQFWQHLSKSGNICLFLKISFGATFSQIYSWKHGGHQQYMFWFPSFFWPHFCPSSATTPWRWRCVYHKSKWFLFLKKEVLLDSFKSSWKHCDVSLAHTGYLIILALTTKFKNWYSPLFSPYFPKKTKNKYNPIEMRFSQTHMDFWF